jgi:ATP-dependent exoDNAse (exonuclease V) beta subunit
MSERPPLRLVGDEPTPAPPASIRVVSASAGTGKTHHLTEVLTKALLAPAEPSDRARPEGVMAITYTRKAAAELQSRLRRRLMREGAWEPAARIRDGYLGTIHAVCDRLLREFAFEAGMSPNLQPLADDARDRLLDEALGDVLTRADRDVDDAARRLGVETWRDVIRSLLQAARVNGMDPAALRRSGELSRDGMRALLRDPPQPDDHYLAELSAGLTEAQAVVEAEAGRFSNSRERAEHVGSLLRDLRQGRMPPWGLQDGTTRDLGSVRKYDAFGLPLVALVERHLRHPRFHDDLDQLVTTVFELAARALAAYGDRKRRARVIDYDDMLAECLTLLGRDDVAHAMAERLDLLLVDEFQDTTPIQLAIILRLAELAGRCVWVGDPKQAIYGFTGSDPGLMIAAMGAALQGAAPEVLDVSWRSRPPLVELCSAVFTRVFARYGIPRWQVEVKARRVDPPELCAVPVLECWSWTTLQRWGDAEDHGIADGVLDMLREQSLVSEAPVPGKAAPAVRAIWPRDIAVLLRRNKDCERVAAALRDRGVPARVRLPGLMGTPEARVARAALLLLADPESSVAAMEIAWLSGAGAADPDAWLGARLGEAILFADDPRVAAVRALTAEAAGLSPLQAYERIVEVTGLPELCLGWPDGARRVANLEALRAEVRAYEELCALERTACTLHGLVARLDRLAESHGGRPADHQAMPTDPEARGDAGAVTVLTYHQSKGLEWPVVVLGSLGYQRQGHVFDPEVEAAADFDPADPLASRWIRWWPYPYGRTAYNALKNPQSVVFQRGMATPEAKRNALRDEEERARLLYVGFTRARDRLCLAVAVKEDGRRDAWLAELRDVAGVPVLDLPLGALDPVRRVEIGGEGGPSFSCRVRRVGANAPARPVQAQVRGARFPTRPRPALVPEIVLPSAVHLALGPEAIGAVDAIGRRARLDPDARVEMDVLGNAIHGFLAADLPGMPSQARVAMAGAFLASGGTADALPPAALLTISDALTAFVAARFPDATWLREWPVRWRVPGAGAPRLLVGEIDLLLDLGSSFVIIDHKSFPGDQEERDRRCQEHAGQLAAYRAAVESATGRPVARLYLHFPLRGEVQEVHVRRDAWDAWLGAVADPSPIAPILPPQPVAAPRRRAPEPSPNQLDLPLHPRRE